MTGDRRRMALAIHEAAHAVVGTVFDRDVEVSRLIAGDADYAGETRFCPLDGLDLQRDAVHGHDVALHGQAAQVDHDQPAHRVSLGVLQVQITQLVQLIHQQVAAHPHQLRP